MSAATPQSEGASFRVPARYRFQKHLGSGSYGVVASFHDHERNRDVAIKRVKKVFDNYLVLRRTLREIRLMAHFRHPNLMRLHKVLPIDTPGGDLYISIELMDCDLDSLIHTKRVVLTDQQVRCFTAQILLGLMAMHAGHVIHRDLKPANIFVRLNRGQVKIGDLGLSRGIAINEESGEAAHPCDEMLTEYVVTRWYRAPEVLLARSKYGPPVDVWSVGCIVYEMCSRKALFPGKNSYDQLKRILGVLGDKEADTSWVPRESLPLLQKCFSGSGGTSQRGCNFGALCAAVCSSDGIDLLQQMCLFNPASRVTIDQALAHPYLAGITSEQDRKTAKAVDPADVAYDKMFDGVGRAGEGAANIQLGRLLRHEVAKFNPTRVDTTPERSQAERTPKTVNHSRTPRGGPQSTAEALMAVGAGGGSARGSGSSSVKVVASLTEQNLAAFVSSDRAQQQPELPASMWQRRRSEPEVDVWARRSGQGTVIPPPSRINSAAAMPNALLQGRRRSADDVPPMTVAHSRRHLDHAEPVSSRLSLPTAPPAAGPVPDAFWLSEDKSPSAKPTQRGSARAEYSAGSVPALRRRVPVCSGSSATTVSTRATPQGSRPGTEASTRASSRIASTSRARVPSVGPQWAAEPEGAPGFFLGPAGPADAANASPRAGPPVLQEEVAQLSARRHNCWIGQEDIGESLGKGGSIHVDRALPRSLRESASTSQPSVPPDLAQPLRHGSHSLASLDEVLREMKAMIRNGRDEFSEAFRDDVKAQDRSRQAAAASKTSAERKPSARGSRLSIGLRGQRVAAVGRACDAAADDRSPTRASARRSLVQRSGIGRQPSRDELDFAVIAEPFAMGGGQTLQRDLHGAEAHAIRGLQHSEAPTPPWAEARKPLESLEPEESNSPDRGPPMPWGRGAYAKTTLNDADQEQFQKVTGAASVHRQLSRSGSAVKRASTSENHTSNANIPGLGFIF